MPRFEVIQEAIKTDLNVRMKSLREKIEEIQDQEISKDRTDEDHKPSIMNELEKLQMEYDRTQKDQAKGNKKVSFSNFVNLIRTIEKPSLEESKEEVIKLPKEKPRNKSKQQIEVDTSWYANRRHTELETINESRNSVNSNINFTDRVTP